MMTQQPHAMAGLVQVAGKTVLKYDKDGNVISTFPSLRDCMKMDNLSDYIIRKHDNKDNLINGYYYEIKPLNKYYVTAKCDYCGKEFKCERFRTEDGRQHLFCSKTCEGAFRKSQTPLNCTCEVCGKKYHVCQCQIDKYGSKYCSRDCQNKARKIYMKGNGNHQYGLKGDKNKTWKSDEKISSYGYKLIRKLNHPFRNCDDFVFEHRLIAEKYLLNDNNSIVIDGKQYLSPDFIVHHINFDRLDNRVDNLIVMSLDEHTKLHRSLRNNDKMIEYCNKFNLDFNEVSANIEHTK